MDSALHAKAEPPVDCILIGLGIWAFMAEETQGLHKDFLRTSDLQDSMIPKALPAF
jgi:hypothetical protein